MALDMAAEAIVLEKTLARRELSHLTVTKRGNALTISSSEGPEARLVSVGKRSWRLDLPKWRGGWEQTPFVADLAELVDTALSIGRLVDGSPHNQGGTSDPRH